MRKAEMETHKDRGSFKSVTALIRTTSFGDREASGGPPAFFVNISPDTAPQGFDSRGSFFWHHTRKLAVFEKGKKPRVVGTVVIGDLRNRTEENSFENCRKQESICFTIMNWSIPLKEDYDNTLAVIERYCSFIQRESNPNECAAVNHSVLCTGDVLAGTFKTVKAFLKANAIQAEGSVLNKQLS